MGFLARLFRGNEKPLCRRPWFDPQSFSDQKLTTYQENQQPLEVDSISSLKLTQVDSFSPWNQFIIYQQWGDEGLKGQRYYHCFDKKTAGIVAKILRGGPTKNIMFLSTMFEPGSIRHFANVIMQGVVQPQIRMLGLCWCFNGASITDEPDMILELVDAIDTMKLERMSILTDKFDDQLEKDLVNALLDRDITSITHFDVFQKDASYHWPRFKTPRLDAYIKMNRNRLKISEAKELAPLSA